MADNQNQATASQVASIANADIDSLLAKTEKFINTMYVIRDSFSLIPDKEHIGTCINRADLLEMRDDFVRELVLTVVRWVYSKEKESALLKEFEEGREPSAAGTLLYKRAVNKFRQSNLKGQFSELLLANLLQHYFKAVPLLRKMPITTNPELERNGADAIHISREGDTYRLFLGEAKTYGGASPGRLKPALKEAVKDILEKYRNHRTELDLYVFEDFIPSELEHLARSYLEGTLDNIEIHLVCIVTYEMHDIPSGSNRQDILNKIMDCIRKESVGLKDAREFRDIPAQLYPRINYIIFPVQGLDDLIDSFKGQLV